MDRDWQAVPRGHACSEPDLLVTAAGWGRAASTTRKPLFLLALAGWFLLR
jgi:hypothetical protein